MTGAVEAFVAHARATMWESLPDTARAAVKTFLLDTLGVGVAGAGAAITAPVRAAAKGWAGTGGVHIWGQGGWTTTASNAAFVNGFQIHCQEFDCVHEPAVVHPLATILAALMAEAEARGSVSGPELGAALAVAVDMAAGLGVAVNSPIRFFRPANAGIFGATVGVAKLRGLSEDQIRNALGYALAFCSGTMQSHVEGKPALPVQIGNAARGAVQACDLAEAGMDGPWDVLEGPFGYFPLFETEWDLAPVVANLGKAWRIAEVSHKPFPTGRAAQGGLVLMQKLRERGVEADAVTSITLSAPPLIERLVGRPLRADMAANYARLCFAYSGAVALLRGTVGLEDFSEAALRAPDVAALARKIRMEVNEVTDPAAFTPQTIVAELTDGSTVQETITALFGSPADPLSAEQNEAKFRACLAFGFGDARTELADRMIEAVGALETLEDVGVLSRLAAGVES